MGPTETPNQADCPSHSLERLGCWAPTVLQATLDRKVTAYHFLSQQLILILRMAQIAS